jgi:hypothetical protein
MGFPGNVYGNGTTTSTAGVNTTLHFYDRAGIKAANEMSIYSQWASNKTMPLKYGKTYKISRWQHIYDRELGGAEFDKYGYLSSRDIADVSEGIYGTQTFNSPGGGKVNSTVAGALNNFQDGEGTYVDTKGTGATDGIRLPEGSGPRNKVSIKKITLETNFARYGEMVDYTDEVDMFSEDQVQIRYREELGRLANRRMEDIIQMDMLSTGNRAFVDDDGVAVVNQESFFKII